MTGSIYVYLYASCHSVLTGGVIHSNTLLSAVAGWWLWQTYNKAWINEPQRVTSWSWSYTNSMFEKLTSLADMTDRRGVSSQRQWVRSAAAAAAPVFCCAVQTPGVTVVLSLETVTCVFSKWACRKIGRQSFDAPLTFPWRATSVCNMCSSNHDTAPGFHTLESPVEKWPKMGTKNQHEYLWTKVSFFHLYLDAH